MTIQIAREIADEVAGLDEEWHEIQPGPEGVGIEWYTSGREPDEMEAYLREMLKDDFAFVPLDGGTELTYQYHLELR